MVLGSGLGWQVGSSSDWLSASGRCLPGPWAPGTHQGISIVYKLTKEAAITTTLAPGAYTAIVRVVNQSVGIGIIEVFEVD